MPRNYANVITTLDYKNSALALAKSDIRDHNRGLASLQ